MALNQKVRITTGLERNHTATVIAIGTEGEGREKQVRISFFSKPGAVTKWADRWINVKYLEVI